MRQLLNLVSWPSFWPWRYLQRLVLPVVLIVLVTQLVIKPAIATGVRDLPNLESGDPTWVVDQGRVLSLISKNKINQTLDDLARSAQKEVRIVTIRRLDYGETPQSFTDALFEKWFPTPELQANQTLLVLDTITNGTAIRTGADLKAILPDEIAESVASETMQVPIRKGNNYNQALLDASDRLSAVLAGRSDPGPPVEQKVLITEKTYKSAAETDANSATYIIVGLLIAATIIPMVTYFIYQGKGQEQ